MRRLFMVTCLLAALVTHPTAQIDRCCGPELWESGGTGTANVSVLDDATDMLAGLGPLYVAEPIEHLCFSYSNQTGTPPTYKISLQGISLTAGTPSGTVLGGGTPAEATFTPPADDTWDNTRQCIALGANAYTPTRGDHAAIVIEHDSGTIDGSNHSIFFYNHQAPSGAIFPALTFSMTSTNSGASWGTQINRPLLGYRTATASYGMPYASTQETVYSSDSTPDEYALHFARPCGTGGTYHVYGVEIRMRAPAATKTLRVQLYSGTTVLQTVTHDGDWGVFFTFQTWPFIFDTPMLATLDCEAAYRIGMQPQETGANTSVFVWTTTHATDMSAWGGGATNYLSTRSDDGAWSDETTKVPVMRLLVGPVTHTGGGGGGGETSYIWISD